MNIGIDARKYFDFGIGTYIRNLAGYFDGQKADAFTYIAAPDAAGIITRTHRGNVIVNRSGKYSPGELVSVSYQANRAGISVFHSPHYTLPFGLSMRRVVTIHDVIHLRFPEYYSPIQRAYARFMIGHACRAADAVIVISEFGSRELQKHVHCRPEKVHVIPQGVPEVFRPEGGSDSTDEFRRKHSVTGRFLLYVGSLKPHKNVQVLIRALSGLDPKGGIQLLCIGERMEENKTLWSLCGSTRVRDRIRSLGWVSETDLIAAYCAASAVVLPSIYEGFGAPLLESMACGTPVIGANAASIPEVIGDAGILFDPLNPAELAQAIQALLDDHTLRDSLREKGLRRAKEFTRARCAESTLNIYRSLL